MNEVFICHLHLPTGEIGPFLTIYAIQKHHIVYLINNFSVKRLPWCVLPLLVTSRYLKTYQIEKIFNHQPISEEEEVCSSLSVCLV